MAKTKKPKKGFLDGYKTYDPKTIEPELASRLLMGNLLIGEVKPYSRH